MVGLLIVQLLPAYLILLFTLISSILTSEILAILS